MPPFPRTTTGDHVREIAPAISPPVTRADLAQFLTDLRTELEPLFRDHREEKEATLMMARTLERMADCYEHLAERLTGVPVEHTDYPSPEEEEDI